MRRIVFLAAVAALSACAGGDRSDEPSLAPRPAERIDPRVSVPDTSGELPANTELKQQLNQLLAAVRRSQPAADAAISAAEGAAARAGPPQSEGWVLAQQRLSVAIAAREPVTRALSDIDALVSRAVQQQGGLAPADLANVREASNIAAAIDRPQAARIDAVQGRLR